jgi:tRNA (guanine37-N1)-methyltransferase
MCRVESLAVKINKKQGEDIRLLLRKHGLLRSDLKIKKNKDYLLIPIKYTSDIVSNFNLVTTCFQKTKQHQSQYQMMLSLSEELYQKLPTSFDVIGDILLIKLPDELLPYSSEIGKALLTTHSHVNTVCMVQPVTGEFRSREVKVIAGKQKTVTTHKEYGLWFDVDVRQTYFSPRLATERKRVCDLIQKDDFVFDMFCGVAPFSIMIAKYAQPAYVLGIDINPIAIKFAKGNILKNKVESTVTVVNKDAKESKQILDKKNMIPDHIIMNLPFSAFTFFPIAVQCITHNVLIHYYDIVKESYIDNRIEELGTIAKKYQRSIENVVIHKIKTYAPHEFYIGIDITVSKI